MSLHEQVTCHYTYLCHVITQTGDTSQPIAHDILTFSTANGTFHIRNFFSIFDHELKLKQESELLSAALGWTAHTQCSLVRTMLHHTHVHTQAYSSMADRAPV